MITNGSKVSFFAKGKNIVGVVTELKTKYPGRNKLARRGLGHLVRGVEVAVIAPVDNPTMFWTVAVTNLRVVGKVKRGTLLKAYDRVYDVKRKIRSDQMERSDKNFKNLDARGLLGWQTGLKEGDKVMVKYTNRYSLTEETFTKFSPSWKIGIQKWNGKTRFLHPQSVVEVKK